MVTFFFKSPFAGVLFCHSSPGRQTPRRQDQSRRWDLEWPQCRPGQLRWVINFIWLMFSTPLKNTWDGILLRYYWDMFNQLRYLGIWRYYWKMGISMGITGDITGQWGFWSISWYSIGIHGDFIGVVGDIHGENGIKWLNQWSNDSVASNNTCNHWQNFVWCYTIIWWHQTNLRKTGKIKLFLQSFSQFSFIGNIDAENWENETEKGTEQLSKKTYDLTSNSEGLPSGNSRKFHRTIGISILQWCC